ncbi:hypothetical protein HJD18_05940 [Thermoleophilia bacterium SCSIO 60948]|nr:hypothetical protein HJD18_05940 [Thermoleophilia bacterium SCSIO 60948]
MGIGLRRRTAPAPAGIIAATALLLATAFASCGGDPAPPGASAQDPKPAEKVQRETPRDEPREPARPAQVQIPEPPACVDDGDACVQAGGRILYVERVDPDGDGDAHFVTTSPDSVTAPGVTVFDVRTDLRPDPLPGPGDAISASGPVLEGSYGQRQIEADAVAVAYAP